MDTKKPARSVWITLLSLLISTWICIIWLAIEVSKTVVAMLEYVVDLAQLY